MTLNHCTGFEWTCEVQICSQTNGENKSVQVGPVNNWQHEQIVPLDLWRPEFCKYIKQPQLQKCNRVKSEPSNQLKPERWWVLQCVHPSPSSCLAHWWWGWQGKCLVRRRRLLNEERKCLLRKIQQIHQEKSPDLWSCICSGETGEHGWRSDFCSSTRSNSKRPTLRLSTSGFQRASLASSRAHGELRGSVKSRLSLCVTYQPQDEKKKNLNFADGTKCLHEANALCQIPDKQAHQNHPPSLFPSNLFTPGSSDKWLKSWWWSF